MLQPFYHSTAINSLNLPPAGLGTVKFGRNQGIKYPQAFDLPDDAVIKDLLSLAQELGIYLLDTAPAYGNSEERLGKLLTQRQNWVLCSKVGEQFSRGQSVYDFSADAVRDSVYRSLQRLNTDYLDIVLIHSDGNDSDILNNGETVEALQQLKQSGVIRAIGLSGKTAAGGVSALTEYDMDIAMITHNPSYQDEQSVITTAANYNKSVFIKKAFASGHLAQFGDNPIQQSMDFIFSSPETASHLSVILGTINPKHLRENATAIANSFSRFSAPTS